MKSFLIIIGVITIGLMLGGVVLYLSVPEAAQAINNFAKELQQVKMDKSAHEGVVQKEETAKSVHTVQGEVLNVERDLYLVREQSGGLVQLHIDANTQGTETVSRGDYIEAKVNDVNNQTYALSIRETN